jgi:dephospho-CoA kinase
VTRPVAVAITGGIGAGKSEALAAFARQGAATLSADEVVHELIAADPEVRRALQSRFGTTDRGAIGKVVFGDPAQLAWLEELLHPRVRARTDAWLAEVEAPLAAVEIPLLFETHGEDRFDRVVVVTAPAEVRRARSSAAGGNREARLIPDAEKVARADYVFENSGSVDELEQFVRRVVADLT